MGTMKKCRLPDWTKTHMDSSFSDDLATAEEQDDLPYDGDVGVTCKYNSDNLNDCTYTRDIPGILSLACSEDSKNITATANYKTHPAPEELSHHHRDATGTAGIAAEVPGSDASFQKELPLCGFSKPDSKEHLTRSNMTNVLLRHFSKGELISACQLIECETIPEISFTESTGDTVNKPEPSEHVQGPSAHNQRATRREESLSEKHEEVNTGDKNQNSLNGNRGISNKPVSSSGKRGCRQKNPQVTHGNEGTWVFQNMKEESSLFNRAVSPHELRYGQGQTHYFLPDLSEAASEIKVTRSNDNIDSVPTTERTKSFPILPSKALTVNNIPEKNSLSSARVENQGETSIPELLQQLQVIQMLLEVNTR